MHQSFHLRNDSSYQYYMSYLDTACIKSMTYFILFIFLKKGVFIYLEISSFEENVMVVAIVRLYWTLLEEMLNIKHRIMPKVEN